MDLNKILAKAINDSVDNKGLVVELSNNFQKNIFNLYNEVQSKNIRTSILADNMDSELFLITFADMVENGEIDIKFNDKTLIKDIEYLEKLSDSITK